MGVTRGKVLTADDLIRAMDELPATTYPPAGQPVVVNGDRWAGQLVVRVADLMAVVGRLARQL